MLGDDVVTEPIDASRGTARVPAGPGLGLELDTQKFQAAAERFQRDGPYPMFNPEAAPIWVPMR